MQRDRVVGGRQRVGFVINGYQLRTLRRRRAAPAGARRTVDRATPIRSTRIARGRDLLDNGAAITFDDCPRDPSGCRPGCVAIFGTAPLSVRCADRSAAR